MCISLVTGGFLAYQLGGMPIVDFNKLLNIVGMIYGLLGALVLSEFVIENERWRSFVVEKLTDVLIRVHGFVPLGATFTSFVLFAVDHSHFPSSLQLGAPFMGFLLYSLLPIFFVEDYVFLPKPPRTSDHIVRVRIFGIFLIVTGIIVQIIAAVNDFLKT